MQSPFDDFVRTPKTPFLVQDQGSAKAGELLWGDGVKRTGAVNNGRTQVRARGRNRVGWVDTAALGGSSLLEIYFIDVGQGDGVLIKTPDFRHLLIDGGHPRKAQNTGKSAADFVDWKFFHDYGVDIITLDAMLASHNDYDHYGGLGDLLDTAQEQELDADNIAVEAFYHAGISWWKNPAGGRHLGPEAADPATGKVYYKQLLQNRASAEAAVGGQGPQLQGEWSDFIKKVIAARTSANTPTPIARLSRNSAHLPGFGPGAGPVTISVLAPLEFQIAGGPALLKLGAVDKTTNGNSILMRLDFGRSRILLTGDLNKVSQNAILEAYAGNRLAFQCDVAKACHHGAEDVSFSFLQAMSAAATVISSGDGEGHDHPRPRVVAASGASGHLSIVNDEIVTPLVYSTELARSVLLGEPTALAVPAAGGQTTRIDGPQLGNTTIEYSVRKPGALSASTAKRKLRGTRVVAGLIYGLVNVRTDGETILTATMNEGDSTWAVKSFKSRF